MKWKKLILLFFLILITACAVITPLEEPDTEIEQAEEEISGEELEENYLVDHQLVDREWILLSLDGDQLIRGPILSWRSTNLHFQDSPVAMDMVDLTCQKEMEK